MSGLHLGKVSSQLQVMGPAQRLCTALAARLLQQVLELLAVHPDSLLQVLLSVLQLQQCGVQGSEVVHRDLQVWDPPTHIWTE